MKHDWAPPYPFNFERSDSFQDTRLVRSPPKKTKKTKTAEEDPFATDEDDTNDNADDELQRQTNIERLDSETWAMLWLSDIESLQALVASWQASQYAEAHR
ncbi:hypothetical protein PHISCL_01389 [Aspergillus sclerotialis]|uniref:Uncharacterized protein n=1 Tax=Aspergillus sclerotialis TaxID=2070753 RepID=A0A3A2ZUC9_9EURO|nr:hypothetical protein PHISCL_01389 [Aspergillus sclerotialis]